MEPIVRKVDDGWVCQRCRREPETFPDALTHASIDHGAEVAWDRHGNVFDGKDPSFLRAFGQL